MANSFTFYLTRWVIQLKGLKKVFSSTPVDYQNLRKDDVKHPKNTLLKKNLRTFQILKTHVTEIKNSEKLIMYVHGGAFVSGPGKHHWDSLDEIVAHSDFTVWMCNYPKSPEHKITEISENILQVYLHASKHYRDIILMGDSAGATLILLLTQKLIQTGACLPYRLLLISPVVDASLENREIQEIDSKDVMLSHAGVLSAKKMCAGSVNLKSPEISPVYGNFDHFPETYLFLATHDITYPDQKILLRKLTESRVQTQVFTGEGMPHIWPLLPVMKEAKRARKQIIDLLLNAI